MVDGDKIGYGRPPKHTRFKKGQSGNPKGRPAGTRNVATEIAAELAEKVSVREGGVHKSVTKRRAMIKSLVAKAIQGNARAALALFSLEAKLCGESDPTRNQPTHAEDLAIIRRFRARLMGVHQSKEGDDDV